MNDRELLEAAAKAAGYKYIEPAEGYDGRLGLELGDNPMRSRPWNPLTSDADAFRLMVDCNMQVLCNSDPVLAVCYAPSNAAYYQPFTDTITDKHAATRRAIVRAAAGE